MRSAVLLLLSAVMVHALEPACPPDARTVRSSRGTNVLVADDGQVSYVLNSSLPGLPPGTAVVSYGPVSTCDGFFDGGIITVAGPCGLHPADSFSDYCNAHRHSSEM